MSLEIKEEIKNKARRIAEIDDEVTRINGQLQEIKSEREQLSNEVASELKSILSIEDGEGLTIADVGFVKLESKNYPKLIDYHGFVSWAEENKVDIPAATINDKTLGAWHREQLQNSQPLPPENLVKSFYKDRIKILKRP